LPSGIIELVLEDYKLHINADKYTSVINGISADEFPVMPAIEKGSSWTIGAKTLKKGLQQVVTAASADEARPVLTSVYLQTVNNKLIVVATDSYRLAEKTLTKTDAEVDLLIPASAMQDLLRLLADYDEEVKIVHNDQQVMFRVGDIELVTRLIDGKYPDYRKLIPSKFATTATLQKEDFVNITKVSGLFARESAGSITLHVDEGKNSVSIRAIASQLGENTATADAEVTGEGNITLNSHYLLDALGALDGPAVTLGFNGKLEPCQIKDAKSADYTHIIMPLKS